MSGFKEPDFLKRQEAAAMAKKAALEKFRAKAADAALADRLTERTVRAVDRKAIKDAREAENAEEQAAHRPTVMSPRVSGSLIASERSSTGRNHSDLTLSPDHLGIETFLIACSLQSAQITLPSPLQVLPL